MRNRTWKYLTRNTPEGSPLPRRLLAARAILFPLDTFYWSMHRTRGYDVTTDTWTIEGTRYTGALMRNLARNKLDCVVHIKKHGDQIIVKTLVDKPVSSK